MGKVQKGSKYLRSFLIKRSGDKNNNYFIKWKHPETGVYKFNSTRTNDLDKATEILREKQEELCGEFNLKMPILNSEKIKIIRKASSASEIEKICEELEVPVTAARKGVLVLNEIDSAIKKGEVERAEELTEMMNDSIQKAYRNVPGITRVSPKSVDQSISQSVANIARKLDERFEFFQSNEHRDDCIRLLKQFSAKLEEWRASE